MTCKSIMIANPRSVSAGDTVPDAVHLMLEHGIRNLPVTDADGTYLGRFTSVHLIELLLPKAATMEGGLDDLTFVHDSLDDIRDRLEDVRNHKVGDYMETDNIVVAEPDTSVIEAMLLLYQHRTHVPVVDPGSRKLVGVVSFATILKAITGDE